MTHRLLTAATIGLLMSIGLSGCSSQDSVVHIPSLTVGTTATYEFQGRFATPYTFYGHELQDSAGRPIMPVGNGEVVVTLGGPTDVRTSDGLLPAFVFEYRLSATGQPYLLGRDYVHVDRGRIAVEAVVESDGSDPTLLSYAWDDGLADALFSARVAGQSLSSGRMSLDLPTAPWREYRDYANGAVRADVNVAGGLASMRLADSGGPMDRRMEAVELEWDESCPFPHKVRMEHLDLDWSLSLIRRECTVGAGAAVPFSFAAGAPREHSDLSVVQRSTASAILSQLVVDGFAFDDAIAAIHASDEYQEHCLGSCDAYAAMYSETVRDVGLIMPTPTRAQQWGIWFASSSGGIHFVAENAAQDTTVSEGWLAAKYPPPPQGDVKVMDPRAAIETWQAAFNQDEALRLTWLALDADATKGAYLAMQTGMRDQVDAGGPASGGLAVAWLASQGGHLASYGGLLNLTQGTS